MQVAVVRAEAVGSTHPWVAEGERRVRFGIGGGPREDWGALREFVQRAEEGGFASYSSPDHPALLPDCWTTLAALAEATRTIRLAALVTCAPYRNPVLLARMAANVERISGGRVVLGLGSGDRPHEFAQLGLPDPPVAQRQAALEETLRVVQPLLRGETVTFPGAHVRVAGAALRPPPVQRPHVPLLVAGGGARTTLRYAARYADATNLAAVAWAGGVYTPPDARRKFAVLRRHCEDVGRPFDSVLRTAQLVPTPLAETPGACQAKLDRVPAPMRAFFGRAGRVGSPAEAVARLQGLVEVGFRYFIFNLFGPDAETVDLLVRRVMPAVVG
jgi:alkanesulfonate monooxygenase SsuD/methylene tetrahydromethanopterin reductase-like flavin-dependent oxidoreductase (luciferase family)